MMTDCEYHENCDYSSFEEQTNGEATKPVAHHETHKTVLHGAPHLEKVTRVSPDHQHAVVHDIPHESHDAHHEHVVDDHNIERLDKEHHELYHDYDLVHHDSDL